MMRSGGPRPRHEPGDAAMNPSEAAADPGLAGGPGGPMGAVRRTSSAVAVRGGRIVAVGSVADVESHVGPRTRRIDLAGRTLVPGFQDAHVHPSMAGLNLSRCPLHELPRQLDSYLDAIRAYATAQPDRPWILGDGWYMEAFPGGTPSRNDLDAAAPDRPAFFVNRDAHGAWVNSRALALAGIGRDTPDPPDGGIERAQAHLHRFGITAWQDAWVTPEDLDAYRLVAERGRLVARVIACQWWERDRGGEQIDEMIERRRTAAIGRLRATTVKIMQDGVAENYTAAMLAPYLDAEGRSTANRGISFVDPGLLRGYVTRLDAEGFQVHFHALGDRAVREALDAIAAARRTNGASDGRHHLAHLQVVDRADIPRFRELGVAANMQPYWACLDAQMVDLTLPYLLPDRAVLQYPFRTMHRSGAVLAGGSDWSVSTPNVMAEIETAVNRVSPELRGAAPFLPEEALDLPEALAAFTIGSAWVNHLDHLTGTIEVGKLADLAVLDRDIFAPDAGPIGDTRVLLTLIEGEAVHEDRALEGTPR